jgi:Predicted nucleotide-binding protein containing TIR-like domain
VIRVPRHTAPELLAESIDQGEGLLERANLIGDLSDYESWRATRKLWTERTEETLGRIYESSQEAGEFRSAFSAFAAGERWQVDYRRDSQCVQEAIDLLVSFREQLGEVPAAGPELDWDEADHVEREPEHADDPEPEQPPALSSELDPEPADRAEPELDLEPTDDAPSVSVEIEAAPSPHIEFVEPSANGSAQPPLPATTSAGARHGGPGGGGSGQVFLVHGRDENLKQAVTDLLERAGSHEITILNERPSDRRMLVEHFDEHPAGSRFAVVLLTADDVGAPRVDSEREPYFSPRARQGVVFEMGVLVAAVTPRYMCVLYEDGVELPFDLDGIAYVRLDLAGTWQSKLLLHMRSAGFEYDLNRLAPI